MNQVENIRARLRRNWPVVFLVGAVYLAYANVYSFAYVYDDEFLLIKNRFLTSFEFLGTIFRSCSTAGAGFIDSFYRPLQITSYLLITQIFGGSTAAYHALNVSLHALNVIFVYAVARKLNVKPWAAFCGAALWALHPLHTEAVTYMSATADPLHVLFILISVYTFLISRPVERVPQSLRFILSPAAPLIAPFKPTAPYTPPLPVSAPRNRGQWASFAVSVFAFGCALMSKEAAIVLPALLVAVVFLTSMRRWSLRSYFATLPHWALAAIYMVLRKTVLNFNGDFAFYKTQNLYTESVLNRTFTFFATLPNYVGLLFWPHDLHIDREFPVYTYFADISVVTGALIVLGAVAGILFGLRRRSSKTWVWAGFAALWFFGAHVPESGVLMPLNSFFLEHWMYLPTIGLALAFAHALEAMAQGSLARKAGLICVTAGAAAALGCATYQQNFVWSSPVSLFSNILQYNPKAERIRHNLAMAYSDLGEDQKALEQYEIILNSGANYPQTYHNVGHLLVKMGDLKNAEAAFKHAIEMNATFVPSYSALVELYEKSGRYDEAKIYREKMQQVLVEVGQKSIR